MGVIRWTEVRIEMHCMGISHAFPMRTANFHTSQKRTSGLETETKTVGKWTQVLSRMMTPKTSVKISQNGSA